MTAKEKKILETYPLRIWNAKDPKTNADVCRAYVPDSTKPKNRRLIQAKDREHLNKKLLDDYSKNMDERLVFANYFANWLITYKSNLVKPDTLQRNLDDYRKFIQGSKLDSMKITDIKRIDIKNLLNAAINNHHLTSKALGNLKSIFNGLFAYAFDAEDIVVNPMIYMKIDNTNIKPEKVKQAVTEVFNEEELDKITEYMYKHYTHKAHKPTHGWLIWADYKMPIKAWVFNRLSFQGRYEGMTDHSSAVRDENGLLTTTDCARNRITVGSTISWYRSANLYVDLRANYEKSFYHKDAPVSQSDGDKFLLEMVLRF